MLARPLLLLLLLEISARGCGVGAGDGDANGCCLLIRPAGDGGTAALPGVVGLSNGPPVDPGVAVGFAALGVEEFKPPSAAEDDDDKLLFILLLLLTLLPLLFGFEFCLLL